MHSSLDKPDSDEFDSQIDKVIAKPNETNILSSDHPMSPPVEVRTVSRFTLNEIYKQSKKMNAKIMPTFESNKLINCAFKLNNSSNCLAGKSDNKMNFTVYLADNQKNVNCYDRINDEKDVNCDKKQLDQLKCSNLENQQTIQPILKPISQIVNQQQFITEQQPITGTGKTDLELKLNSTLNHALKSNYAYLSFQDSFNIKDYQSFDSPKSSIKSSTKNSNKSLMKNPTKLISSKQSIDSYKLNRSKSNLKSIDHIEDLKEAINMDQEIQNVESDIKDDNYLYNKSNKRTFHFRTFVDAIRLVKNWATRDKLIEESFVEDFNSKMLSEPIEEKEVRFFCFGNLVIDSNKSTYYYWLIIISFSILYNLLMIVGRSTFWELQNNWANVWIFLDYFCDFVYLIDIAVNSRTAYLEDGLLVRDSKKLWTKYNQSIKFKLDIISSLPTDFYFIYSGLYCDYKIPCSVIIRLNKLVKIYRLIECFDKIETRTNYPNIFRIAKMIFIILVVIHWNGCLYFYMSYLIGFSIDKWTFNLTDNPSFSEQYIYSFYWSTLTLTAIGEVPPPTNDAEYLFVTFNFLIGVLIFATIVGNIGSIITNMNQSRAEFQAKMDSVKQYMEFRKISKSLENRVIKWFDYLWQQKQSLDEDSVLNVLPDKLKTEIAIHVHLSTLKKVHLFQGVDNRLLEQLVLKLRLQVFSPGDYICRKGDVGKEMYIVKKGRLSVVSEDGQTVFANLTDGAVFGELSVLNIQGNKTGNRRSANVRSVGYSDLFCLYKSDLMQVLEEYPDAKEMLIERAKEMLRKDGLLDEEKLLAEEQMKENLMFRYEQMMNKYEQMTQKFARFIAEYSVSQRKLKQRVYQLEKNLENSKLKLNEILIKQESTEVINQETTNQETTNQECN